LCGIDGRAIDATATPWSSSSGERENVKSRGRKGSLFSTSRAEANEANRPNRVCQNDGT
jgi:hypothetical protein